MTQIPEHFAVISRPHRSPHRKRPGRSSNASFDRQHGGPGRGRLCRPVLCPNRRARHDAGARSGPDHQGQAGHDRLLPDAEKQQLAQRLHEEASCPGHAQGSADYEEEDQEDHDRCDPACAGPPRAAPGCLFPRSCSGPVPPFDQLTKAFPAKGIGHATFVVLYSHATPNWAPRLWWMLRAVGFDDAAILDGGLDKWKAENRPLSTEATTYPPATLTLRGRPEIFVDKNAIKAAIGKTHTLTLNALSHDQHKGTGGVTYGRRDRIAGSSCVPAASLLLPDH